MSHRLLLAAFVTLVGGCAAPDGDYPSLLPRPIEQTSFAEPDRAVAEAAADPALEVKLAEQAEALASTGAAFDRAAAEAERLGRTARGAATGSEPWIAAQVALSGLDALRGATSETLTDIERIAIDRAAQGLPAYPELQRLLERAQAQNRAQIDRIDAIEAGVQPAG
ncbi:hypothetical protein OKW76_01070 [Sphingomonas sp. S1-29]|uniref:hypothetical protein n=1 Tax=Sphingomonas sp. S1-29 TaxID=2991074 RepID=UPI00223EE103|nr:hypothetical protein [Sphingomonas sp. S1-29]UZK69707.1 hypothetical protein OKW76_01070 [Sphingomonas sp. S1-29]